MALDTNSGDMEKPSESYPVFQLKAIEMYQYLLEHPVQCT